ncbi:aldehyde ferredoxin oxidoreductase N-terminal domain-containing protein [Romboutsia sp.]|uniref:aldehyde ferredoxin oxidoreductase N-terminal domain-containing protein n=1 Tax=Romboutsia sp. TaxID=1965302 RepID=UPI002CFC6A93|nr:aldehyde ferredoxin oxidoreductase N-terminal domain-containing protein [Romboutsia sp.]HSQ88739.1 aldehyde ferredoxin oxidoreductase N-terminal domain-containing protein [Romboutsia sp.]
MKKILHINLNNKKVKTVHQYDECKINLNGDNLVFEAPPLAGYGVVGLNRLSVYNKTSLSQSGSHFAHFMKCNGYDYLIFEDKSDYPVYVYIDKENISIKEATHIYNEDYESIHTSLKKELENDKIEIATVGMAGINNVDFAKIIFRNNKSCGKDGLGKLMATKNLKAIVLKNQENLMPHDNDKFKKYNQLIAQRIINNNKIDWYDENNSCYGCCLNCKNTAIDKIQSYGFNLEEAKNINKWSDFYGMDSVTLAQGIDTYKKTFDTEIIDLNYFIQNIINNYDYYRPLFIKENTKIKKKKNSDSGEKLGFCKILLQKNILSEKEKKILVKCILGLNIAI